MKKILFLKKVQLIEKDLKFKWYMVRYIFFYSDLKISKIFIMHNYFINISILIFFE